MLGSSISTFLAGAITCGFVVIAAFFLRFWRRTGESLFVVFSAAFVLLAVNQAIPILFHLPEEDRLPVYLFRAAAFILIIIGILVKNLPPKRSN